MRKSRSVVVALSVAGLMLAGCGESSTSTETVPFKKTDTSPFEGMKDAMTKNVQKKSYTPPAKPAPAK